MTGVADALKNTSKGKLIYKRDLEDVEKETNLETNLFFSRIAKTLENLSLNTSTDKDEIDFRYQDKFLNISDNTINNKTFNVDKTFKIDKELNKNLFNDQSSFNPISSAFNKQSKLKKQLNSTYQPTSSDYTFRTYETNEKNKENLKIKPNKIDQLNFYENKFKLKRDENINNLVSNLSLHLNEINEESNIKLSEIRQNFFITKLKWLERYNSEWNALYDQITSKSSAKNYDINESVKSKLDKFEKDRQEIQNELFKRRQKKLKELFSELELIYNEILGKLKNKNIAENEINSFKQIKLLKDKFELLLSKTTPDNLNENILKEAKQQLLDPIIELNNNEIDKEINEYLIKLNEKNKEQQLQKQSTATVTEQKIKAQSTTIKQDVEEGFSCLDHTKHYIEIRKYKINIEGSIKEFSNRNDLKQYRSNLLLFIKTTINSISSNSQNHIDDKINRLTRLFSGQNVEYRDQLLSLNNNKDAFYYCIYNAANSFLTTGLKQVLASTKSAYSFAQVIVALWIQFDDFGKILQAFFYEMCPYTVPYYPTKDENDDELTYKISCGYCLKKDGSLEEEDKFLNNMRALIKLYAAIIQTVKPNNPLNLRTGWIWLASILNLDPIGSISPAVLHSFLSIADSKLKKVYGKQFVKLIKFIKTDYLPKVDALKLTNIQAKSQLQTYIDELLNTI